MGGLYNTIFGSNPLAHELLQVLGVQDHLIPRYRDCFLNEEGTEIIIYTRTGGPNREDHQEENQNLRILPGYLGDHDEVHESTYALFRYAVPEGMRESYVLAAKLHGVNSAKRWLAYFQALGRTV